MLKVGLTGNIGSGKSLAAGIFKVLRVPVFDADRRAKDILTEPATLDRLRQLFGEGIFRDGNLDKKALAALVFPDSAKLQQLKALIHPLVRERFAGWCRQHSDKPYVLYEAAILLESGHARRLDSLVVVTAPAGLRLQRVMQRDGASRENVEQRMQNQWSEEKKCSHADYLITNDGSQMLIPQVLEIHKKLIAKAAMDQSGE